MGEGIKGGLISEKFSTLAQISKYECQITTLGIFFFRWIVHAQGLDFCTHFLSQSEKLSEIMCLLNRYVPT